VSNSKDGEGGHELVCPHCSHRWRYSGSSDYFACCPRCRGNVNIIKSIILPEIIFYPKESDSVKSFVNYWSEPTRILRPTGFDGFMLSNEYKFLIADLASLRLRTHALEAPVTASLYASVEENSVLRPGFDPDFIEEAIALAAEIEAKKASLQSLRQAILNFVEIANGPTIRPIESDKGNAERRLQRLLITSDREQIAAIKRTRLGADPMASNPRVEAATKALEQEESHLRAIIAANTEKVQRAYKIIEGREKKAEIKAEASENSTTPKADAVNEIKAAV
jgi:hypothetical protein